MTSFSVAVTGGHQSENREAEHALAAIVAFVPLPVLQRIAAQLEQLHEMRTWGGLDINLNTVGGSIESAGFAMRSHYRVPRPKV